MKDLRFLLRRGKLLSPPIKQLYAIGESLTSIIGPRDFCIVRVIKSQLDNVTGKTIVTCERRECTAPSVWRVLAIQSQRYTLGLFNGFTADMLSPCGRRKHVASAADHVLPLAQFGSDFGAKRDAGVNVAEM